MGNLFIMDPKHIRNVAIIAHVDHGKTTLLDGLLKQSHTFRANQAEMSEQLIMDSGDQEHERGITITAKQTAIYYDDYKINIIDTPGHADFSGEVERTLNMADGALLIVDAQEGPMPQTKFVLAKALEIGLKIIVIINKIDKPARRIAKVEDEIADLFLELATDDSQLQYPIYYAIAKEGKAWEVVPKDCTEPADLSPIFKAIIKYVPEPKAELDKPFQMLVTALQYDSFVGKYSIGRITQGVAQRGMPVMLMKTDGEQIVSKIDKLFNFHGLGHEEVESANAGDIVALSGISDVHIGDTIADKDNPTALPAIKMEAPTISMYFGPNTSPMKGREGKYTTSRQIGDRLMKELETNVALRVEPSGIGYIVSGRGELHLSVLIEALRREDFELEVGRPQVVTIEEGGVTKEPIEELTIEVGPEFIGEVSQELGVRHGELVKQDTTSGGSIRSVYYITTRGTIGLRNSLMTLTKGTVIINSLPHGYQPLGAKLTSTRNGALIAFEAGLSTPYSLQNTEARGTLFIGPATEVYAGMIVGLNHRQEDLEINVCRAKHLTNMRSKASDGAVQLTPYTKLSLEQSIDILNNDELLEITPTSLRLRKRELDSNKRKRTSHSSL